MSDTTFTNGVTLTDADWFNDVNRLHYTIFNDPTDKTAAFSSVASSAIAFTGDISPSQITGNQNDYNPTGLSTASVLRLTTDASRNITGIQGGADGRILKLLNVGSFPIVLKTADTGSSAANRFDFDTDLTLQPDQGVILYYDSTDSRWRAARTTNGEFRSVQVFTSTGANTWTKPAGLKRVKVTVVGGGGGSGGVAGTSASDFAASGGAGAGGASIKVIEAASLGATETATVGAGGPAGSAGANNGSNGGTSSFGAHCSATGGFASGGVSGSTVANGSGYGGGSGSGGDINIRGGGTGYYGWNVSASLLMGGTGGNSIFGGGGPYSGTNGAAVAGTLGGGASGVAISNSQSAMAGAAGGNGIIIIEEFF